LSRGALEWLQALRERAERRAAETLRARRAALAETRRLLRDAGAEAVEGRATGAAELAQAARRARWAGEEVARRARQEAEACARALESRSAAEVLRVLLSRCREARLREGCRRQEVAAGEELLARRWPGDGRDGERPSAWRTSA